MARTNTKAAQIKRLIQAAAEAGLAVTSIEIEPRRIRPQTPSVDLPRAQAVAKSYADLKAGWKMEERRHG